MHRGSKCLFPSPRVYRKDRGVSSPLWSSFNHTLITDRRGRVAGEAKKLGWWEADSGPRGKGGDHTAAAAQILIGSQDCSWLGLRNVVEQNLQEPG